ncbi:MAG: hypothetical protein ABJB97_05805 [Acidobacteriota bacterium]
MDNTLEVPTHDLFGETSGAVQAGAIQPNTRHQPPRTREHRAAIVPRDALFSVGNLGLLVAAAIYLLARRHAASGSEAKHNQKHSGQRSKKF